MKEKTMECQGKRERDVHIYRTQKKQQNRRKHYKK